MSTLRTNLALGLLLVLGYPGPAAAQKAETIYHVRASDKEMNAAKAEAIATLPDFYALLARPAADTSEYMVKFDILPGEDVEYVWAGDLDRTSSPMTGLLLNQPVKTSHQAGQRVPIGEQDIIDWTYRRGGVMQGGFTNRVLLERMPPDEASSLREYLGW